MTTIRDVARTAGVSVSTVSRVLNESGYVSSDAKKRVEHAAELLKYMPNGLARGLVSKRTSTIGLLIPDVSNPFFAEVARGIEDAASSIGYSVILCNSDWQVPREEMYINNLHSRWVDGVVIAGARSEERSLRNALRDLPFVLVDRRGSDTTDSVWTDNEQGGFIATRHLLEEGCKKIVHISGPSDSPSGQARLNGYLRAINLHMGVAADVIEGDFRFESGFTAAKKLLSKGNPPDAIFAGNDMMALGVIQAAQSVGCSIPEKLKVVGYDNISFAAYVSPALTTVEQRSYTMGSMALTLLADAITNPSHVTSSHEIQPKLIVRKSSL